MMCEIETDRERERERQRVRQREGQKERKTERKTKIVNQEQGDQMVFILKKIAQKYGTTNFMSMLVLNFSHLKKRAIVFFKKTTLRKQSTNRVSGHPDRDMD
jgi:hypothetical protein